VPEHLADAALAPRPPPPPPSRGDDDDPATAPRDDGGCAELLIGGVRHSVDAEPETVDALVAAAADAWGGGDEDDGWDPAAPAAAAAAAAATRPQQQRARLARALADRAGELPPERALRATATSAQSGGAAERHARDAALVMMLERHALLRARDMVLRLGGGDGGGEGRG